MPLRMSLVSTDTHPTRSRQHSASEVSSLNAMQSTSVVSSLGWLSMRQSGMNGSAARSTTWRDVSSFAVSHQPQSPLRTPASQEHGAAAAAGAADVVRTGTLAVPSLSSSDRPTLTADMPPSPLFEVEGAVEGFRDFVAHLPKRATLVPPPSASTAKASESESPPQSLEGPSSLDATKRPIPGLAITSAGIPAVKSSSPRAIQGGAMTMKSAPPSVSETTVRKSAPAQLPPSNVPSHRIHSPSRTENATTASTVTVYMNDSIPFSTVSRRVGAFSEAAQARSTQRDASESSEAGFVIMATRRKEKEPPHSSGDGGAAAVPDRGGTPSTTATATPAASMPASPTSQHPLQVNPSTRYVTITSADAGSSDSSGASSHPRDAFYRYLEDTRKTVLAADVSEEERAEALDGLVTRSRELFDLLDGVRHAVADTAERRRYSMLKVVPYDGVSASSTTMMSVHSRAGAAAPAAGSSTAPSDDTIGTALTTTGEDTTPNPVLEPLSLTTRSYATQLPPLGPAAALRLLGGIERGRRSSLNSCSSASVAYIDVVNHYCVIRLLGIGATGRVYLALDRRSSTYYAMKTVPRRSRRSNARQFPLRRPSSFSESSVLEGTGALAAPVFEATPKLPPRYTTPMSITTAAGGAVPPAGVAADGTSPGSIIRTTCFPASAVNAARQLAEAKVAQAAAAASSAEGLCEDDMEHLADSTSHASGMVIPYVESVGTAESSSISPREAAPPRDCGMEALLMEDLQARPSPLRVSGSFARRPGEPSRTTSHMSRYSVASSAIRSTAATTAAATASTPTASRREQQQQQQQQPSSPSEADLSAVEREIRVLRRVQNHTHVVQLKEVVDDDDEDCSHLIMTYAANGPMTTVHGFDPAKKCVSCNVVRPFPRCARLLRQLAEALMYVHRQRIVHNDVKPDNILLTASDDVLLTDFGESVLIPKRVQSAATQSPQQLHTPRGENPNATVVVPHNRWKARAGGDSWVGGPSGDFYEHSASYRLQAHGGGGGGGLGGTLAGMSQLMIPEVSFRPDSSMFLAAGVDNEGRLNGDRVVVGSPAFAAPELIESSLCSYKSDTWSFGVVLYAIVFGCLPFAGASISETFEEILHSPLTFPPLEAVPHGEELTEATYDQWVLLCSRLLVREPQQRLSLSAVLRHPLLRAAVAPPPGSGNAAGSDALSLSRRSASTRQVGTDSAGGQRRSAHQRTTTTRLENSHEDVVPISRTARTKSNVGTLASPWPVVPEPLMRSPSPRGVSSGASASHSTLTPTTTEGGGSSSRGSRRSPSPSTPPPPPPLQRRETDTTHVPSPPALTAEKTSAPPPSRLTRTTSKKEEDSTTTLSAANQNSTTQLPSLPPPPSRGTDTLPPSCSSNTEVGAAALPSPPGHLREKTLAYYQGSELGSSGRTVSPTEASLFSVSNRMFHDYRYSPSGATPLSAALMMDCAVVVPTATMRPDASTNGATGSLSHPSEREEMRRLGLGAREGRSRSQSGNKDGSTGAASAPPSPPPPTAAAAAAVIAKAASSAAEEPPSSTHTRKMHASETHGDFAEHAATERSVGGVTRKPQDDDGKDHDEPSSSNLEDALSQQESALNYYSYWNESEGDAELGSSSSEEEEVLVTTSRPVSAHPSVPHTPHGSRVTALSPRPSLVTPAPHTVPVLTNQEEVLSRSGCRTKSSVVRSKRQRGRSPAASDARQSSRRQSRVREGPSDVDTVHTTPVRSQRGSSSTRRDSAVGGGAKASAAAREKRGSTVTGTRDAPREEQSAKQPTTSSSRSWFRRRH